MLHPCFLRPFFVLVHTSAAPICLIQVWILWDLIAFHCIFMFLYHLLHFTDFSLSGGCFGTDIQKCTKWSQIGVHGLKVGQIFAKFQCAFFWFEKGGNMIIWVKQMQKCNFSSNRSLRSYNCHTKLGKKQFVRYNLIKLYQFN